LQNLLESGNFPVEIVNIASAKEKGPGRPPFWEMIFWWTRKPLASARAVILASLLSSDFDVERFIRIIFPSYMGRGRFSKTPHFLNPNLKLLNKEYIEKIKRTRLLDPFAGFGSIPLEAVRLGVGEVVASELLPTAVVFLRAVLEYPKTAVEKKIERQLLNDVERWGRWVLEELKKDPDVKELYDPDVAVYIGTWEIKCPYCGRYTPLIGNWWLARVKGKRGFKSLAWMIPVKTEKGVEIKIEKITDRSVLLTAKTIRRGRRTIGIETGDKKIIVGDPALNGEPNIDAQANKAVCLYCHANIKGTKEKWHVKEVLREWNERLKKYLNGEISLEELRQSSARPRLLVKVRIVNKDLEFEPAKPEDDEKLWKALEKLKTLWGDPDIPTEPMTPYGGPTLGDPPLIFKNFYRLFNPRQLLTLVKLVKLIREAGKKIEEEKLREGWSREEAFKYAEAVATYLAIALARFIDHNNLVTLLHPSNPMGIEIAHALSMRGIAMQWNWGDTNPFIVTRGMLRTNSFTKCLEKEVEALTYLFSAVFGSPSKVKVLLDDATSLEKLGEEKFDLIITDPPYRDDVPYAELSDFYYVWLKRVLSDNDGVSLRPRFHVDLFFPGGVEVSTQWEWFASREVSLSEGRCEYFKMGAGEECERVYERLLKSSFNSMVERLNEDGVLITYFAQSSPEAWSSLLEAGLGNGLYPVVAFPVITESEESVISRGKSAISASIVIAWRKIKQAEPLDISVKYDELVEKAVKVLRDVEKALAKAGGDVVSELYGVTIYVMSYARILSLLASGGRPVKAGRPLDSREIARLASEILARAYVKEAGASLSHEDSIFYLVVKKVFPRGEEGRRLASSSDLILLSYGVGVKKERALEDLERRGVLKAYGREEETEVASRKTYMLIEPAKSGDETELSQILKMHNVYPENPATFRSPVHVLHALMLYALKPKDVFTKYYERIYLANPSLVSEAVELAKALTTLEGDPEAELASRVIEYLGGSFKNKRGVSLYDFTKH
jgi:putative DNA methylase